MAGLIFRYLIWMGRMTTGIVDVLVQNILPIFMVAGLGFVLQRQFQLDVKVLSRVAFNVFSPCLVFSLLVGSELPAGELVQIAAFSFISILACGALAYGVSRVLGLSRPDTAVIILTTMFANAGNFGLTLNKIRYGEEGLTRAVVYFVCTTILVYTIGVLVASAGNNSWRDSLRRLSRVPAIYALILALIVYNFNITLPAPLLRGVDIAADGAIPLMLIILGIQMANLRDLSDLRLAIPAVLLRLVGGAAIGVLVASLIGLEGLSRSTSLIELSMPTAVITTVLATEFDLRPSVVTSIVVLSTLLSPITLSIMINWLGL